VDETLSKVERNQEQISTIDVPPFQEFFWKEKSLDFKIFFGKKIHSLMPIMPFYLIIVITK
jgi:hypothetical protein